MLRIAVDVVVVPGTRSGQILGTVRRRLTLRWPYILTSAGPDQLVGMLRLRFGHAFGDESRSEAHRELRTWADGQFVEDNEGLPIELQAVLGELGVRYLIYDPRIATEADLTQWLNEHVEPPGSLGEGGAAEPVVAPAARTAPGEGIPPEQARDADALVAQIEAAIVENRAAASLTEMGIDVTLIPRIAARAAERERLRDLLKAKNSPTIRNMLLGHLHDAGRDMRALVKPHKDALDSRVYLLKGVSVSVIAGSVLLAATAPVSWPVVVLGVLGGAAGYLIGRNEEGIAQTAIDTVEREREDYTELRRILSELPG